MCGTTVLVQRGILSSAVFCQAWYFDQYGIISTGILKPVFGPVVFCTAVFCPQYFDGGILFAGILTLVFCPSTLINRYYYQFT